MTCYGLSLLTSSPTKKSETPHAVSYNFVPATFGGLGKIEWWAFDISGVRTSFFSIKGPEFFPERILGRSKFRIPGNHRPEEFPELNPLDQFRPHGVFEHVPTAERERVSTPILGTQDMIVRLGLKFQWRHQRFEVSAQKADPI